MAMLFTVTLLEIRDGLFKIALTEEEDKCYVIISFIKL